MMTTVPGIYRNGKIELTERPSSASEGAQVIVTFLDPAYVDLRSVGIDQEEAAELRGRFATFAEDWDAPEMEIYDRYDAVKAGH
jgi:hypothetical protein